MRIGELASRTGVDPRLLRYYERQGLLHPAREANGYRDFDEADVPAVIWIRRLLGAGLSTATIAEFQACVRYQGPPKAPGCQRLFDRLTEERARIDGAIAGLVASRAVLDEVIGAGETMSAAS